MIRKLQEFLFFNKNPFQTVAKNTFWLFFGQISGRLLRAAIVIYAARLLGAANWGAFSYALGVAAFLTIFSDIGINALVTKIAAREPESKEKYISTAFFTKIGLLIILAAVALIAFPYLTKIPEAIALMPIAVLIFSFDTIRELGSAISRALEKMEIEASIGIFTNLAIVVLGFLFLSLQPTAGSLAVAYAVGSGLGLIAIFITLKNHLRGLLSGFDLKLAKEIFFSAWPFGLMGLMGVIMLNTDIIMLGWLRSSEEVGYYSAAQKPIQLLYVLPTLLATSVFPMIARLAKLSPEIVKNILEKALAIVVLIAIPITVAGVLLANPIMNLLFGVEYAPGIATFQILMLTILIVYPSTIIGNAIFAFDQQKHFITFTLVAALGNVAFNFLLIPRFGIEGAAISTVTTQLITNILIWYRIRKMIGLRVWPQIQYYLSKIK